MRAVFDTWKKAIEAQSFLKSVDIEVSPIRLCTDNSTAVSDAPTSWRNRHLSMFTQRLREEVQEKRLQWQW
eukprot:5617243-Amphidinium_carterae.1